MILLAESHLDVELDIHDVTLLLCTLQIMSKPPVASRPDSKVADAACLMLKHKVHRIPIVDNDARVCGIVSSLHVSSKAYWPAQCISAVDMLGAAAVLIIPSGCWPSSPPQAIVVSTTYTHRSIVSRAICCAVQVTRTDIFTALAINSGSGTEVLQS